MHVLLILICLLILPAVALADSGQIGGLAWNDTANDHQYNEGDRLLNRVTAVLYRVNEDGETQLGKVTTGTDGAYAFTDLPAGNYRLNVTLPEGYQFITPQDGGSVIMPACGTVSSSLVFSLAENEVKDTLHIGASKASGYIKAYAFHDENANAGRRTTEEMLRYIPTDLLFEYNGEWIIVDSAKTDKDGCVTYWDLTPGTYRLAVTLPDPYIVGPVGEKLTGWYNNIVPADSNYGRSEPFNVPRGGSTGLGIGAVKTGSIAGNIWYDINCNGLQDADETGYAGAALSLINESAGVSRTLTSDENGNYLFEKLLEGTYSLTVTLPQDVMFTLPGGESLFTEGYVFTQSTTVSVETEKTTSMQKIGVIPVTTLAVQVYNDLNANGLQEEGEPPFAGAGLNVIVNGTPLLSASSDGNGLAFIPVLRGGDMQLQLSLPAGQVFTVPGEGNAFTALDAQSVITLDVALPHGENSRYMAGVTLPASISGTLFNDSNISSLLDNGEGGLEGFTVQAINMNNEVAAQTATDKDGFFRFDSLLPAQHTIRFCLPDAYVFTDYSDAEIAARNQVIFQTEKYGETEVISLVPGQAVEGIYGGAFRSATVSGEVLLSAGKAAQQLTGGMEDVFIELLTEDGIPVSDTTTAYTKADGSFYLKGALPGTYCLQYTLPEGCIFTKPLLDNNVFISEPFVLDTAVDLTMPTLSAVQSGGLSGTLYYDSNVNGLQDESADMRFDNIVVTLVNTDFDMTYETRTTSSGSFIFYDLRPGAYEISLSLSDGLCFAYDASSLIPATTASAATAQFTLLAGEQLDDRNIAIATPAALSGTLYFDLINNNEMDADDYGAKSVTVVLQSVDALHSYTAITDDGGAFAFDSVVPGNYQLLVSLTSDCIPADGNPAQLIDGFYFSDVRIEDGEQASLTYAILRYAMVSGRVYATDGSLKGVAGRTIKLYDENGTVLKETLTDENGVYSFSQLKPANYSLTCDLPDSTYQFARKDESADIQSVILHNPAAADLTGSSDIFYVPMGETVTCPIGIGSLGRIGDTAWLDENSNGLQDAGERGIPGIVIEAYYLGEKVAETVTDGYGRYQLVDLFPGIYTLKVTMPEEVKTTAQRTDYPLLASVLTEGAKGVAEGQITVPSGSRNLNCDLGFVLVKEDKYPAAMENLPQTDWDYDK